MITIYRKPKKSGGWTARTVVSKERSPDGRTTYAYMDGTGDVPDSAYLALAKSKTTRKIKHDGWERWIKDAEVLEVSEPEADSTESENAAGSSNPENSADESSGTEPIDFDGSGSPTVPGPVPYAPVIGNRVRCVEGAREVTGDVVEIGDGTCQIELVSMRIGGRPYSIGKGAVIKVKTSTIVGASNRGQ